MQALIFDTETTGTPKDYKGKIADLDNWPRVIQLAWQSVNIETGEPGDLTCYLIKPDKWIVPNEKFWIENNLNTQRCKDFGAPIEFVLNKFLDEHSRCDLVVAHNMAFDFPILSSEMYRYKYKAKKVVPKFCTMQSTIDFCKIPYAGGYKPGYKFPKLKELYQILFKKDFTGAHDAGYDVMACRECFIELLRKQIIQIGYVGK